MSGEWRVGDEAVVDAEEIARSLPCGVPLEGVTAVGARVLVTVRSATGVVLDVEGDDAIIEEGMPVTLRVADGHGVSFIQLVAASARGVQARLTVVDALRVPNERGVDRSTQRLACALDDGRFAEHPGEVCDFSAVGVRVRAAWPVVPGDTLGLAIALPVGEPVGMTVAVVRTKPLDDGRIEFAGEVLALTPSDWARLAATG
jgi:hypothetical protein